MRAIVEQRFDRSSRALGHRLCRGPEVAKHESGGEEGGIVASDLVTCPVHCVGDLVLRSAREILVERSRVHFVPGPPCLRSQTLGAFENVIRDGYSGFHTRSITPTRGRRARGSDDVLRATSAGGVMEMMKCAHDRRWLRQRFRCRGVREQGSRDADQLRDCSHPLAGSSTLNRLEPGTPDEAASDRCKRVSADPNVRTGNDPDARSESKAARAKT